MNKPLSALFLLAIFVSFGAQVARAETDGSGVSSYSEQSQYPVTLSPQMAPLGVQPDLPPSQARYQAGSYHSVTPNMAQEPVAQPMAVPAAPQREKTFGEKFEEQRKILWQNMKRWADVKPDPRP
jgi:hypothetical protein